MSEEVARAAFRAFKAYCKEYDLKAKILNVKFTVADLRAMEAQGQPTDVAVWVAVRTLNQWKKVVGESRDPPPRHRLWRHFVQEVHECRFGSAQPEAEAAEGSDVEEVAAFDAAPLTDVPMDIKEAALTASPKTTMLAGLLCDHGLLCRPRAACLVHTEDMEALLKVSEEKDKAFQELWPEAPGAMRPKLKTGLPGNRLLSFGDVCSACRGALPAAPATEVKRKAPQKPQAKSGAATRGEESEGSAFNNSVFLSSSTAPRPAAPERPAEPEPPLVK
mmetsp:Transcript_13650/g.23665  ORF Transcript_13650/g.23665 Transcript_13650/m.23665 type:complete len:276 (-) Transcript_13650:111-938(-)